MNSNKDDKSKKFTDILKKNNSEDKALQKNIDKLCEEIHEMSKDFNDMGEFNKQFLTSDLYGKYTNAISDMLKQNNTLISQTDAAEADLRKFVEEQNSVLEGIKNEEKDPDLESASDEKKSFFDFYHEQYDKFIDCEYRSEAKEITERIFKLEKNNSDPFEGMCAVYEEDLPFELIKKDHIQLLKTLINGSDNISDNSTLHEKMLCDAFEKSVCQQQAVYLSNSRKSEEEALTNEYTAKMIMAQKLSVAIADYYENKLDVLEWESDMTAQNGLKDFINARRRIKNICDLMKEKLSLDFDDIANDEKMKIWLLSPVQLDETGKIKSCLPPKNIEVIRIILTEALSDKLTSDILREGKTYDYRFSSLVDDEIDSKIKEKCEDINKDNLYFKHKEDIDRLLSEKI